MKDKNEDWVNIGMVVKLPINKIPEVKDYLNDIGLVVYTKISGGKLILKETMPSGMVYDRE